MASSSPFEGGARGQGAVSQHANGRHSEAAGVHANDPGDYKYSDNTSTATPATQDVMEALGEQGYHPYHEHQPGYDDPVIREAITQTASRWLEDHPEFTSQSGVASLVSTQSRRRPRSSPPPPLLSPANTTRPSSRAPERAQRTPTTASRVDNAHTNTNMASWKSMSLEEIEVKIDEFEALVVRRRSQRDAVTDAVLSQTHADVSAEKAKEAEKIREKEQYAIDMVVWWRQRYLKRTFGL